jgi:uncharacterized membrane protein
LANQTRIMKNTIEEGKTTAITAYILGIGVLIAMSMNAENKNSFASFHIRQGLGLTLSFISIGLIISNFNSMMITLPFWIFISTLWTYAIITAIKGQTEPVPLVGKLFQKLLASIS